MLRKMSLYIQKTETWRDHYSPKKKKKNANWQKADHLIFLSTSQKVMDYPTLYFVFTNLLCSDCQLGGRETTDFILSEM